MHPLVLTGPLAIGGIGRDRNHSPGLAALRGLAAISVVIFHVLLILPTDRLSDHQDRPVDLSDWSLLANHLALGVFNGGAFVTLFFVLSGCVLALSLARRPRITLAQAPGYLAGRAFRLYPLLIVAATLGALLQANLQPGALEGGTDWASAHYDVPRDRLFVEWVKNAIGASAGLNSPVWSIKIELLASFIFPVLYLLSLRPWTATVAGAFFLAIMFVAPGHPEDYWGMNVFTFSFFLGALIPRYGRPAGEWYFDLNSGARRVIMAITLFSFMFAGRLLGQTAFASALPVLVETTCAAVLVALVLFGRTHAFFEHPVVQELGRISYGVYLLHRIVPFALAYAVMPMIAPLGALDAAAFTFLLCAATLAISIPLAWCAHRVVEAPTQRLGARLARGLDAWCLSFERRSTSRSSA